MNLPLHNDVIVEISSWLPLVSSIQFLSCCKTTWNLRHRAHPHIICYMKLFQQRRWEKGLKKAASNSDLKAIHFFGNKGASNWYEALERAARVGPSPVLDLLIQKGFDCIVKWNHGMKGAARGGHTNLVNFFLAKGANDWQAGAAQAARGGHEMLVNMFRNKITKITVHSDLRPSIFDWDHPMSLYSAAEQAAKGGHMHLVETLLADGAYLFAVKRGAASKNQKHILGLCDKIQAV